MSSNQENKCTSLDFFVSLLDSDDSETVMNVAGTLGTLVENADGRHFIISQVDCLHALLIKVKQLLSSDYLWTSNNAALILARLSIDVAGNSYIVNSSNLESMLPRLIECLTFDEAGRGMNTAFALGRILDNEATIKRHYDILSNSPFIENLVNLVDSKDSAFMKNSCFCLSSIMDCNTGFGLVISNHCRKRLIILLEKLLLLDDDEVVWFCVLTLKAISVRVKGCQLLKMSSNLLTNINTCLFNPRISFDVKRECNAILEYISPLSKPPVPCATLITPREVNVSWSCYESKQLFGLRYQLYYKEGEDEILAYRGKNLEVKLNNLVPNTKYQFYINISNDIETSESSNPCIITTDEDYPSEPQNLVILVVTSTQVKIGWDEPEFTNGVLKSYSISLNKKVVEQTVERVSIISGLHPETSYSVSVFAINSCGKSKPIEMDIMTLHSGAHAPDKPQVVVLGRSEMHITWFPPEAPLGRIFRYDVKLNKKKIVYSGTNTYCKVTNLKSNTEYSCSVVVVTSVGKYESPICKKKTTKDEYSSPNRGPLYSVPSKPEIVNIITQNKRESTYLIHDPKILSQGVLELVNSFTPRRHSEYDQQKVLYSKFNRVLPSITTSRCSLGSNPELPKLLEPTQIKIPTRLLNDDILPLKTVQTSEINKSLNYSTINVSCSSFQSLLNFGSRTRLDLNK